jgi:hypothetical protein
VEPLALPFQGHRLRPEILPAWYLLPEFGPGSGVEVAGELEVVAEPLRYSCSGLEVDDL